MSIPKWTIYCHIHIESGRRYIGLTKYSMMHRWNQHCAQAKTSKGGRWHFPNAIRKYGKEAFSHKVLETCLSLEEANMAEDAWIESFSTRDPEFGFNLSKGGGSQPHLLRKNPWEDSEYRKRCTEAAKVTFNRIDVRSKSLEVRNTAEAKARQSLKSIEVNSRPEVRAKASAALTGRVLSLETRLLISLKGRGKPKVRPPVDPTILQEIQDRNITHLSCKRHGLVPVLDCQLGRYESTSKIRIRCRQCIAIKKRALPSLGFFIP